MKPMILIAAFSALAMAQTEPKPAEVNRTLTPLELARQSAALAAKAAKTTETLKKINPQPRDSDSAPPSGSPVLLTQVVQQPVTWTLSNAECSLVKNTLTATGFGQDTISLARNPSGGFNYTIDSQVYGTATDTKGFHYMFIYKNVSYVNGAKGIPQPNPPFSYTGPDVFQLIPIDGGIAYTINIYFNAKIAADGSFVDLGTVANQNPNCDPI